MAKLICLQIMNKVVSECFEVFGYYSSLDEHPLETTYQKSKMIQISNSKTDLLNRISNLIIEKELIS